jgi:hypothetical protein
MQYLDASCKGGQPLQASEHRHLAGKLLSLSLLILLSCGFEMCSKESLLIIGVVLKVAAVLLGRTFWVFAVCLRLVAVAWISAVGT